MGFIRWSRTLHLLLRRLDDPAQIACGHDSGASVRLTGGVIDNRCDPHDAARREDRSACTAAADHEIGFDVVLRDVPHDSRCRSPLLTNRTIDGEDLLTVQYV